MFILLPYYVQHTSSILWEKWELSDGSFVLPHTKHKRNTSSRHIGVVNLYFSLVSVGLLSASNERFDYAHLSSRYFAVSPSSQNDLI